MQGSQLVSVGTTNFEYNQASLVNFWYCFKWYSVWKLFRLNEIKRIFSRKIKITDTKIKSMKWMPNNCKIGLFSIVNFYGWDCIDGVIDDTAAATINEVLLLPFTFDWKYYALSILNWWDMDMIRVRLHNTFKINVNVVFTRFKIGSIENLPLMHLRSIHLFHCIVHFRHSYPISQLPLIVHTGDPINPIPLFHRNKRNSY